MSLPAIPVRQWLEEWNNVHFSKAAHRRRPEPVFYVFSISAAILKGLSGISRRTTKGGLRRDEDLGIQRRHEANRSRLIGDFIRYGYPWSELKESEREDPGNATLRKPGWLPTAIVVNVLAAGEERQAGRLERARAVTIDEEGACGATLRIPAKAFDEGVPPLEVIDGQHRLWAFEEGDVPDYQLPVVAFRHLDRSWQAYLFWVINIKPKRINPSLAFDLYPLLRAEDWLDRPAEQEIYRRTRAQELVEALWSHPKSPWHQRINMLGDTGVGPMVSQAAWIHSLTSTFVKSSRGKGIRIGGLFGGTAGPKRRELAWNRTQQASFLIAAWRATYDAVHDLKRGWAKERREDSKDKSDAAFYGRHTLLSTDQGVRAVLSVTNDLVFLKADELQLSDWVFEIDTEDDPIGAPAIDRALASLGRRPAFAYLERLGNALAGYDWRRSTWPELTESEQLEKSAFRGSGGYRLLRREVLRHIRKTAPGFSSEVTRALRYAE